MSYPVQKFPREFQQFCIVDQAFSPDEIEKILDMEDLIKFREGITGDGSSVNKEKRNSDVMWLMPGDPSREWLFQKFSHLTSMVNYDHFMYDITHFDAFQYTKYDAKKKQHYDWHIDSGGPYSYHIRKISVSLLLSDPEDYDGGEFICILGGQVDHPVNIKPKKGDAIFFPSYVPHKVNPITSGIRRSLVTWIMGPRND